MKNIQNILFSLVLASTSSLSFADSNISSLKNLGPPADFEGKMLVSVSDADMLSSAYVNGKLGPREGRDTISVIPLGKPISELKAHEIEVSNSVAGPAVSLSVTPDGLYGFVIETFKPRPKGAWEKQGFSDLSAGNTITVVDLSKPSKPSIVQKLSIAKRPDAVSVNALGDLVAVTFHPSAGSSSPLALIPFKDGQLGEPSYTEVNQLPKGNRLIHAEFHPKEPILALVDNTDAVVSFAQVKESNSGYVLEPWGNSVDLGKSTFMARFTPNGRYLIANNLYWGADVQGKWTEAPRGDVVSIRINAGEQKNGDPRHALVSRAMTSVSPEGLTISPDGTMIVTANLERSYLPYNDERITWFSSLTLINVDSDTGELTRVSDYVFDGVLPEAVAFDASSRFLAVTNFDHFDNQVKGGSIDFWRVSSDPLISGKVLVKMNNSVPVRRGAHSMVLVK